MSEAAHEVARRLASSGSPSPGPEARQLVAHVLGVEVSRLIAAPPPTPDQRALVHALAVRHTERITMQANIILDQHRPVRELLAELIDLAA